MQRLLNSLIAEHARLEQLLGATFGQDFGDLEEQLSARKPKARVSRAVSIKTPSPRVATSIGNETHKFAPQTEEVPLSPPPAAEPSEAEVASETQPEQRRRDFGEQDASLRPRQELVEEMTRFGKFMLERFTTLEHAFQDLDKNRNGALSRVEFAHALQRVGYPADSTRIWNALQEEGQIRMEQFENLIRLIEDTAGGLAQGSLQTACGVEPSPETTELFEVCVHKLQTKCAAARFGYITNHDIAALLTSVNVPEHDVPSEALVDVFTYLGATMVKPKPTLFHRDATRGKSGTMTSIALRSPELQVTLVRFAELLVMEEISDSVLSDKSIEALALVRAAILDEHSIEFILSAMDIKHRDLSFDEDTFYERVMDVSMSIVIVANAACIGIFSERSSEGTGWGTPQTVDLVFTIIFLTEMLVKIGRTGLKQHFFGKDARWNCFDGIVVTLGISDSLMTLIISMQSSHEGGFNPSSFMALRMIRLARIARLARVLRISLLRELQLMVNGIVGLLRTLLCALLLLFLCVYFLGIVMTQLYGDGFASELSEQDTLFSDVPRSMFTVFRCLMVGDCAALDGSPIALHMSESAGWPFVVTYSVACVLMNYGIGSLITALVVDSTINAAKQTEFKHSMKLAQKRKLGMRMQELAACFELQQVLYNERHNKGHKVDALFMDRECFVDALQREEVKALLDEIEIDDPDRLDLFDVLDADGNGRIEMKELVDGVVKMRGKARKADVVATRLMLTQLMSKVTSLESEMRDNHREVVDCVMGSADL